MCAKVSFVVPCYNLAHLLPECINSILAQSYEDFEILVMDDCSSDATPEVAQSFCDQRVRYVRNEKNLKHLANYNKGIGMARGTYVWLISADDILRKTYIVERYVSLMDKHPEVGYVFCPAMELLNDRETVQLTYSYHGDQDRIFDGKTFLIDLLVCNRVVAASGMVRKECYEKVSLFPPDLPYAGDWYLWCVFAMNYDVAYFSEAMVCYRQHTDSMTNKYKEESINILFNDDIAVLKRIRRLAQDADQNDIVLECDRSIINKYVRRIIQYKGDDIKQDAQIVDGLLHSAACSHGEIEKMISRIYAGLADHCYWSGDVYEAGKYYNKALRNDWKNIDTLIKYILLFLGNSGKYLRSAIPGVKRLTLT